MRLITEKYYKVLESQSWTIMIKTPNFGVDKPNGMLAD